jgi:hypothetical protein
MKIVTAGVLGMMVAAGAYSASRDDATCGLTCAMPEPSTPIVYKLDADLDAWTAELRTVIESPDAARIDALAQRMAGWSAGEKLASAVSLDTAAQRAVLEAVLRDLTFRRNDEASTPPGWPPMTPIGEVELKQFPAYRAARIDTSSGLPQGAFFWQLFSHIQRNNVSMTAPVEMGTAVDEQGNAVSSMAFLYEHGEQGSLGKQGHVDVVDVPARLAVVAGLRGEFDARAAAEARRQINAWLDASSEYRADGEPRFDGYNGPGTPSSRKYYEIVQSVVKTP